MIAFGLALWVGGFAWAAVSIHCPSCGTRLLWKALREQTLLEHERWLLSLDVCPVCGSDGRSAA
jgi:rRNA maturation protein Nop10